MKITRYTTIDIYFNEDEQKIVDKRHKELLKQGYELNLQDAGEPFDYCNQYIKYFAERKKKGDFEEHNCEYVDTGKKLKCRICGESIGQWLTKKIKKEKQNKKHKNEKDKRN